jgi:NADP-dependent 3-hydroxy acid dehydrogenase YdfG
VYAGTKFAVRAILQGLREELASDHGVRVSQVSPGIVDSDFATRVTDPGYRERAATRSLLPKTPDDVAEAVLYALVQPAHVAIGDVVVYPSGQSS